jgi:hypothetical protein
MTAISEEKIDNTEMMKGNGDRQRLSRVKSRSVKLSSKLQFKPSREQTLLTRTLMPCGKAYSIDGQATRYQPCPDTRAARRLIPLYKLASSGVTCPLGR